LSLKIYKRRTFLKTLSTGTIAGFAPNSVFSFNLSQKKLPNILFIVVDDLRPQLGCYGHRQMISPNIDRLAEGGTLFKRTYCQVPVCGASRASLLTGVRPTRNHFIDYKTMVDGDLPGVKSLPKYLKESGYYTISNGKIFHHKNDCFDSWSQQPWRPKGDWVGKGYLLEANKKYVKDNNNKPGPPFENIDVPDNAYSDGKLTEKAIADLQHLNKIDKPFFLAVGYLKPHLPFNAPKRFWEMYNRKNIDLADNPFRPKGAPDAALHNWGELRKYADIPKKGPLSEEMARILVHGYYACVSYTDYLIGQLLAELDRLGMRKNTIIVLWGDHGWNLGEHGLWCKHCNFETSLHSPMIVNTPWHRGNQKTNALTEFVDIYPSLCELSGLSLPGHLEGKSFAPLLEDPDQQWKKAVFSRYKDGDSIKTHRYRYTEWTNDQDEIYARMLYDHLNDPFENNNISKLSENKVLVEKLSKMLNAGWRVI